MSTTTKKARGFKLSDADVAMIRALYNDAGLSSSAIAEKFEICREHVWRIVKGKRRV